MKRTFLILFLSFLVTGISIDDIYAKANKTVSRPSKPSAIKSKKTKKAVTPKKEVKKVTVQRPASSSVIKKKDDKKTATKVETKKEEKKTDLQRPASSSVIKKKDDKKTATKLTPVQKSAVDKKLAKHKALKGKKFNSKKEAEDAYRKSLETQRYDKRPEQRPEHVPEYYEHNGRRVQTEFYEGRYGYYESPGIFRPYTTNDFIIDMLVIDALTSPRTRVVHTTPAVQSAPVVHEQRPTNKNDVTITILILAFLLIVIIGGVGIFLYINRKK